MGTSTQVQLLISAKDQASSVLKSVSKQMQVAQKKATELSGRGFGALRKAGGVVVGVLRNMISVLVKVGAVVGVVFVGLATFALKSADTFEKANLKYETLLGSQEEAIKRVQELKEFAAKTPFSLERIQKADIILQGFGIRSEDILHTIGDAAAVTEQDFADLSLILGQLSQSKDLENIKQLVERGVISFKELEAAGIKFAKDRSIVNSVDETYGAVVGIMEKKFGGGMIKLSQTLTGRISTLRDEFILMLGDIAQESGLLDFAKNKIAGLIDVILDRKDEIIDFAKNAGSKIAEFTKKIGDFIEKAKPIELIGEIWDKLKEKFSDIGGFDRLKKNFEGISKFFSEGLKPASLDEIINKIGTFVNIIWTIGESIGWVITKFQQYQLWVDTTAEKLGFFGNVFKMVFSLDLAEKVTAFINIIKTIPESVKQVFVSAKEMVINRVNEIKEFHKNAWESISQTLKTILNGIKAYFVFIWTFTKEFFFNVLEIFGINARDKWEEIKNKMGEILDNIHKFFVNIWNSIKEFFKENLEKTRSFVENIWSSIADWLSDVWNSVKDTAISVWNKIRSKIESALNSIKSAVEPIISIFNDFKKKAEEAWEAVKEWSSDISFPGLETLNSLVDSAVGFFNDLTGAAKDAYNAAKEAVSASSDVDSNQFGGAVQTGRPTIVGENGPEVFVPSQSGNIRNAQQLGQFGGMGATVNITVNAQTNASPQAIADEIRQLFRQDQQLAGLGINTR